MLGAWGLAPSQNNPNAVHVISLYSSDVTCPASQNCLGPDYAQKVGSQENIDDIYNLILRPGKLPINVFATKLVRDDVTAAMG